MSELWLFLETEIQAQLMNPPVLFALIILSTFVLEDPTTLAVGYLLSQQNISWAFALSSLSIGIFLGDLGLYLIGRGVRVGLFKNRQWDHRPSLLDLFIARFVPGLRALTFSAAGFFHVRASHFVGVGLVSSLLWSVLLLFFSSWLIETFSFLPSWAWALTALSVIVLSRLWRRHGVGTRSKPEENL